MADSGLANLVAGLYPYRGARAVTASGFYRGWVIISPHTGQAFRGASDY